MSEVLFTYPFGAYNTFKYSHITRRKTKGGDGDGDRGEVDIDEDQ